MDVQERIDRLSPDQRMLLARRLEPLTASIPAGGATGSARRLVAYIVTRTGNEPPPAEGLRRYLGDRLPAFMVPSAFVPVGDLPLLPSGKVDRKALAARSDTVTRSAGIGKSRPATGEARLLDIWRALLENPAVGPDDDFFEMGGDSILAIQMISRAAQAGVRITLSEFFRSPTVAQLVKAARGTDDETTRPGVAAAESTNAPVPLTPIQHWLFEQDLSGIDHWNQAQSVEIPSETDDRLLAITLHAVVRRHDALRLAFVRKGAGWQQLVRESHAPASHARVDVSGLTQEDRARIIEHESWKLHASIRLDSGLLLKAVRFHGWSPDRDLLLLAAHHVAVDVISWGILLEDLETAYQRTANGEEPVFPEATASFSQWARALFAHAQSDEMRRELPFWGGVPSSRAARLPRDVPHEGRNDEASADMVATRLGGADTARLVDSVVPAHRVDMSVVVLTAVVRSVANWAAGDTILVGLEGHGRGDGPPGIDVSRTVGWFTSYFPVLCDLLGGVATFEEALRHVKELMRAVPGKGVGYGLLRYLTADAAITQALGAQPAPEVIFNYLGHERSSRGTHAHFRRTSASFGQARSPLAHRTSVFEINSWIADGQLQVAWSYSRNLHHRGTVERLAGNVIDCLATFASRDGLAGGAALVPSDFPDAGLDQSDLDRLIDRIDPR